MLPPWPKTNLNKKSKAHLVIQGNCTVGRGSKSLIFFQVEELLCCSEHVSFECA